MTRQQQLEKLCAEVEAANASPSMDRYKQAISDLAWYVMRNRRRIIVKSDKENRRRV